MMRRLRTLHIDAEKNWGGGERQVAGLCTYLRDQGHEVTIACRPGSKLQLWVQEQGLTIRVAAMKSTMDLGSVLKLRSIIAQEKPDVVHLHTSRAHVLGSAAARLAGAKVVVATRRMDMPVRMVWPNTSAYSDWVTALVAISGAVRDAMIASGVDPGKIRLIESGTDIDRFVNASPDPELRASLGIDRTEPVICTAATLEPLKGIEYLIEAARMLKQKGRPVHLLIAGDGSRRRELETLAERLQVKASFAGFRTDMPNLLALTDVFVMSSLSEGLGIAVLEAMAAGKPMVASAVGGLRESVVDGVTGFLVPPRDADAIANAVWRLLVDPDLAARCGSAGRTRVEERYSISKMGRMNEELYLELVAPHFGVQCFGI